jgi:hypothetical protein
MNHRFRAMPGQIRIYTILETAGMNPQAIYMGISNNYTF